MTNEEMMQALADCRAELEKLHCQLLEAKKQIFGSDAMFAAACNDVNALLFSRIGATKSAETLYDWGVRGGETPYQIRVLVDEYVDHIKD